MKYFTPERYARGNSEDDRDLDGVEEEWERALEQYDRRLAKIQGAFPESVRKFHAEQVCLHDAELVQMVRDAERLVLILLLEPPRTGVVVMTFDLAGPLTIQTEMFPERLRSERIYWLYEEFDRDRRGTCRLEVLFSNGWVVTVRFRDFQYVVGEPVADAVNGRAGAESPKARRA
jgi:hypothetical protein